MNSEPTDVQVAPVTTAMGLLELILIPVMSDSLSPYHKTYARKVKLEIFLKLVIFAHAMYVHQI